MTDKQWNDLVDIINGKLLYPLPAGFIIDCPWLPNWYGIKILDYFTNDQLWLDANLKAVNTFPDIMFLPGFWSEFGMCSEPSAFGAKCWFPQNEFPHADKCILSIEEMNRIKKPNPETDGLAPFILNRLKLNRQKIEDAGHKIRFSVSRGPLNIASYLMGTTEFLMAIMTNPDESLQLIEKINNYLIEWHALQHSEIPTIEGILILDDIIGFMGEEEFKTFGLPFFKELFNVNVKVKLLHNDADCKASLKFLPEIGVNMFNMAFDADLNELKKETSDKITMLGNIPPRDVLATGIKEEITNSVNQLVSSLKNKSKVIFSCGGGMPPRVSTESINFFMEALHKEF